MKTKFLTVVLFLTTISVYSFGQGSNAILRGGLNLANVSITSNGSVDDANLRYHLRAFTRRTGVSRLSTARAGVSVGILSTT